MLEIHRFKAFTPDFTRDWTRADLEIYGIDHFRPSYTGLVFLNADELDPKKVSVETPGYAGSFSVFGHPDCVGDEGHCHPRTPGRFDPRRSHPLTKAFKRVIVTDSLRAALDGRKRLQISIVVGDEEGGKKSRKSKKKDAKKRPAKLFDCAGLQIVTFA